MHKILVERPGGFERLEWVEAPSVEPGEGEVLISTHAIGVNFADCVVRMGLYPSAKEYVGWPITPGFEFSGRVESVGAGVTRVKVGDCVFGVTRFGAYAERVVAPEHQVFHLPAQLDPIQAGAFPVTNLTAWYALRYLSRVRPGDAVLVQSAAGGVGSALVQMARILECRVIGVVGSPSKIEAARRLGCDEVVDRSRGHWWQEARRHAPSGYAVVLDASGVDTLRRGYDLLRPMGRLVVYGFATMLRRGAGTPNYLKLAWSWLRMPRFNPLHMTDKNRSVLAFNLSYLFDEGGSLLGEAMDEMLQWVDEGKLRVPSVTEYPLAEAARAHADIQSGNTVGKLVLTTGTDLTAPSGEGS